MMDLTDDATLLKQARDRMNQGFPDLASLNVTEEERDQVEGVCLVADSILDAEGRESTFRLPPAVALGIIRILKPGALEAWRQARSEEWEAIRASLETPSVA